MIEVQPHQLINLSVYMIFIFAFIMSFRSKKTLAKILRYVSLAIVLIMFFVNPIRGKVIERATIERSVTKFNNVPERIIVNEQSFEDFNKSEIDKLKKMNEERKNEIHN